MTVTPPDPAWDDVKTWFARALDEPTDRRTAWLAAQPLDTRVRDRVARLLAAHDEAGTFMERPFLNAPTLATAAIPSVDPTGQTLGAYRLLREIGRGGMGIVYLGERADGLFDKQVAIKVVGGPVDASLRERFESERRVLATLEHPNIARLLDGGTGPGGAPYLVMELVDGVPIDTYCTAHALETNARLGLFVQVCSAVRYAHQHFVVHRDLKPNNVLVTHDGTAKLLDFGIAKVLDPARALDQTAEGPLTPSYASPEQLTGGPVTTASDVYSLGVILYRLLTDRSPYPASSNTPGLMARAITEHEVTPPSTVTQRRDLRGDLDAIVLRALEKDPRRRYESIAPLADDVARYLAGLPVSARRDSWTYRSWKFVRRHRAGVAATLLLLAAIAAGVVATVRQSRIAEAQRRLAERRFNDVRELANSLIFEIHDAIESLPGSTPARELLLARAVTYLDTIARDAAGDTGLQRELARGYQRLAAVQGNPTQSNVGDSAGAIASTEKAAALFDAVAAADSAELLDRLNSAMGHRLLGSYLQDEPRGRQELDRAMTISAALMVGAPPPQVLSERALEFESLGFLLAIAGERAAAAAAHEQSRVLLLEMREKSPDYPRLARRISTSSSVLAYALYNTGQRARALELGLAGLKEMAAVDQADPGNVQTRRNLALMFIRTADFQVAEGDMAAAAAGLAEARGILTPLAAADSGNQMLQLDMVALDYMEGRLAVLTGQPQVGVTRLQRAAGALVLLKAVQTGPSDIPARERFIDIWTAEAEAALGHLDTAQGALTRAIRAQEDTSPTTDDERAALATSRAALARLWRDRLPRDPAARAAGIDLARRALAGVEGQLGEASQDMTAVYPAVHAYLMLADFLASEAAGPASRDCAGATAAYNRARALAARFGAPARISPLGLAAHVPADLPPTLDVCTAGLAGR